MPSTAAQIWAKMLEVMEYDDKLQENIMTGIPTTRKLITANKEALMENGFPLSIITDMLLLKDWYQAWVLSGRPNENEPELYFTQARFDDFVMLKDEQEKEKQERMAKSRKFEDDESTVATRRDTDDGLYFSSKLDAKDVPKLLKGDKPLRGQPFDDWYETWAAKMGQAGCEDILEPGYTPPDELDEDYALFKRKEKFLRSHLMTATQGTNAYSFIDPSKQTGLEMLHALLEIYQGEKHAVNDAVRAAEDWVKLEFGANSRIAGETFLSKHNSCLKRMETVDENGTIIPAINQILIPNFFRAKIKHPSYQQWHGISEKTNEDWKECQASFLREGEKMKDQLKTARNDRSDKLRTNNVSVSSKTIEERIKTSTRMKAEEWKAATDEQRKRWLKVKKEKKAKNDNNSTNKNNNGGIPQQYASNMGQLEPGTIIIPPTVSNVQGNANNQVATGATTTANNPTGVQTPKTNNQTNQQRAKTMLQLSNGNYVICNQKFQLSTKVANQMSRQSHKIQDGYKSNIYVDGGTNISAMGRAFRILAYNDRYADMSGFANDLVKNDVPIGSGLTKCVDNNTGFEFLLGLHESPYLEENECSLISTGQTREAGTWLSDVLRRHGGDQRLVAPIEGSDAMADIQLEARDGLLAIECQYPTEDEVASLPRVWLTSDSEPWDPRVLDADDDIVVTSCWDGVSDFEKATKNTQAEMENFGTYQTFVTCQRSIATTMLEAAGLFFLGNMVYQVCQNVATAVTTPIIRKKPVDYEKYRPCLGWLPLETVRRTFECTTQLAMNIPFRLPMRQHFKSRTPQLNRRRLAEVFATDTFFSNTTGLGGVTCAQLFSGLKSRYVSVHGMKSEQEGPEALEDFIREKGAPYAVKNDNSKMQLGQAWMKLLRKYNIASLNTEPHHPHQNEGERRIQDVKKHTEKVLDRTGAPRILWFFAILYVVTLMNFTAMASLGWITPFQACFGYTPDISALLQYTFYQPILYGEDQSFPQTKELYGHWIGVAENKGDALTYWIYTEQGTVLARSLVRPVEDKEINKRAPLNSGDHDEIPGESFRGDNYDIKPELDDFKLDMLSELANSNMPTVEKTEYSPESPGFDPNNHLGMQFIRKDQAGVPTKTTVTEVDEETGKVLLEYIHGNYEWVMPNIVQEAIISRAYDDDGQAFHSFKKIINHRTESQGKIMVEVLWDNDEVSWEPLAVLRKDDPVTLASYASERKLLEQKGWKWARRIAKSEKKLARLLKLMKAQNKSSAKYKFGVELPRIGDLRGARELDTRNGNTLWYEAQQYEANALMKMDTFEEAPADYDFKGEGYQYVPMIYAFDVKFDGRRRARMVANGAVVQGPPADEIWSGVVSTDSVRTLMFLAVLNDMKLCATDISSAYLMAKTKEKMYTRLGPEFGHLAGKTVFVRKALYGLAGSCAQFHQHLSHHLFTMGFVPSKADSDVWMRDRGDHYEYIAKYIDDLLIVSKNPMDVIAELEKPNGPYGLKGTGTPEYYLGGDVNIRYDGDKMVELSTSAKTYIKRVCDKIENLMEWRLRHFVNPMDPNYHPELDETEFLTGNDVSKYRMMVGSLNWLVTLGRYDIQYTSATLARHMMTPRQGHLKAMQRVFGYLKFNSKFKIKYDATIPDFSMHKIEEYDWFSLYGPCSEEVPYGMPEPKGKPVVVSGFFDASHSSCLLTRRSTTAVMMFMNSTPVKFYSKRQNAVETSTFGSEMVAGRIAVDLTVELRYNLRMLGVPVSGTTVLFGDNKSMITNTSLPHSTLKKRSNANAYHRVREAVAAGIVSIVHCNTKYNLSDIGTKALGGPAHQFLLQNQNFPPASSAGECQTGLIDAVVSQGSNVFTGTVDLTTNDSHDHEACLSRDMRIAVLDKDFMACLTRFMGV